MFNTYSLTYVFHELDKNEQQTYLEGFIFVCDETWNKFIDISKDYLMLATKEFHLNFVKCTMRKTFSFSHSFRYRIHAHMLTPVFICCSRVLGNMLVKHDDRYR